MSPAFLVGLIGRDIKASRSPWLHECEARAQQLRLLYMLFDFAQRGWSEAELPRLLEALVTLGAVGCNVTYPYKQAVIPLLDVLSPAAAAVGAVNTVTIRDGRLFGDNTDITGFGDALAQGLGNQGLATHAARRVVQIGAGGAGAATAQALLDYGVAELVIFDVENDRAARLVERLAAHFPDRIVTLGDELAASLAAADGLVNATPMGMARYPGLPVPAASLTPHLWVADIVYVPLDTALVVEARRRGCTVIDGSAMAIGQAAAAFTLFTGRAADLPRMRASFGCFDSATVG